MRRSLWTPSTLAVAVAACFLCCDAAQAKKPEKPGGGGGPSGPAYNIIPFAPFGFTSTKSFIEDLNEMGTMAVGGAELPSGQWRAVHLDIASGDYTTLADGIDLLGINNHGQMVGSENGAGKFWDGLSATPVELPPLAGDNVARGGSINDAGIIVGSSRIAGEESVGVVWRVTKDSQNAIAVDGPFALPTTSPDELEAYGSAINELADRRAQVVGRMAGEAVVWTLEVDSTGRLLPPAPPQGLGMLNLSEPSGSNGRGINNDGDAVGYSDSQPFLVTAGEAMEQLSLTRKARNGVARDINDADEIVGSINILPKGANGGWAFAHAALWKGGEPTLLESLIDRKSDWESLTCADDIADNGVIAGYGRFDVQIRGFLMVPNATSAASTAAVPEPATGILLLLGVMAMLIGSRTHESKLNSALDTSRKNPAKQVV